MKNRSDRMENNSHLIRLSQAQLNLLETCPPQFQHIYLEQLRSPISPEQQEKLAWGSRLHLLMQQIELGLPIEALLQADRELGRSIAALLKVVPEILQGDSQIWRDAEHYRTVSFNGYLLTAIYDLLITEPDRAKIIDWKTYLQPENKSKLATNWQTRLYLYLLAETSDYLPENISMTYLFVNLPSKTKSLTFTYSSSQHEKTKRDITSLLSQLDLWLKNYADKGIAFPHLSTCQENCPFYKSVVATTDVSRGNSIQDWLKVIEEIEEISI
ncbi:MAG: PD-(D/E)XK nuclease family protein [Xenococcaceae cyanobacterium]